MELNLNGKKLTLYYLTVVGSVLQGLDGQGSDIDYKGVFNWSEDVRNGLRKSEELLGAGNMTVEDRKTLMDQLNSEFNLNLNYKDDLDLFDARFFFNNAMKSDHTMLDMLYANTVEDCVLYCSDKFKNVLDNRFLFLDLKLCKHRFLGMSLGVFKLGSKDNGKSKDLAKSLQHLYSYKNLLDTNDYNPRLNDDQKSVVLDVKFNLRNLSRDELISSTNELRIKLESEYKELELSDLQKEQQKVNNYDELNRLLLKLNKKD